MLREDLLAKLGHVPTEKGNGKVILLHGTSSAGKTTLSKLIQEYCYSGGLGNYMYWSQDDFVEKYPSQVNENLEELAEELPRIVYAFNSTIPEIAKQGINMIVDHVFTEEMWAKDFFIKMKGIDIISVGVTCSLEKTIEREKFRGDRPVGLAAYQYNRVHQGLHYDLTVDTTTEDPERNVEKILEYIKTKK